MDWGAYEVFSVISGVVLIIVALIPGAAGKERLWAFLGGAFFIAYGIFVASRTSGTWIFPIWIFVIPFAGVGYLVYRLLALSKASSSPGPPAETPTGPGAAEARTLRAGPVAEPVRSAAYQPARALFCSQCGTRAETDARYCAACGTVLENA
jgi:hypothetical protein